MNTYRRWKINIKLKIQANSGAGKFTSNLRNGGNPGDGKFTLNLRNGVTQEPESLH